MNRPPLCFVLQRSPRNSSLPGDCLDAVMTAALLDQPVTLVLRGDGLFALTDPGCAQRLQEIQAMGGIELVAVEEECAARRLEGHDALKRLGKSELTRMLETAGRLLSF